MKRPTRKKLLRRLEDAKIASSINPVLMFTINFSDADGVMYIDEREMLSEKEDVVARLMDLSFTHRIVNISYGNVKFTKDSSICVNLTVIPDKEYQTNIDGEFMERIMEMRFEYDGTGKAVK